jgi:hypothetical protein
MYLKPKKGRYFIKIGYPFETKAMNFRQKETTSQAKAKASEPKAMALQPNESTSRLEAKAS